uniref:Uncharacterized protein MANES_01G059200 n=1 Tax=Rhizophora mucronata TaxID=61149 RepID=A0A2P2L580_RHIMU
MILRSHRHGVRTISYKTKIQTSTQKKALFNNSSDPCYGYSPLDIYPEV